MEGSGISTEVVAERGYRTSPRLDPEQHPPAQRDSQAGEGDSHFREARSSEPAQLPLVAPLATGADQVPEVPQTAADSGRNRPEPSESKREEGPDVPPGTGPHAENREPCLGGCQQCPACATAAAEEWRERRAQARPARRSGGVGT